MSWGIFISYKRADDPGFAQALFDRLSEYFSRTELFMDIEGYLEPGEEFVTALVKAITDCNIVLAIVGPRWLQCIADNPKKDFVVLEIQSALQSGKRIIPVLVGGAALPPEEQMPSEIAKLARLQAVTLRPDSFKSDADRLVRKLTEFKDTSLSDQKLKVEIERVQRKQIAPGPITSLEGKLFSDQPKRILCIDGGAANSVLSIAFIEQIEREIRARTRNANATLSDHFDLFCGTSIGAVIATFLALGHDSNSLRSLFNELTPRIFSGRRTLFSGSRFHSEPLVRGIRSLVKDLKLGSPEIKTGLAIGVKRFDTSSAWMLTNNPRAPYFESGEGYHGNSVLRLESILRAAISSPMLPTPTEVRLHDNEVGQFVDGSLSTLKNPSLELLIRCTLPSYNLNWKLSPTELNMISIGSGFAQPMYRRSDRPLGSFYQRYFLSGAGKKDLAIARNSSQMLESIGSEIGLQVLKVMQSLSSPRFGWRINSEVGNLESELLLSSLLGDKAANVMRFQRYDVPLVIGAVSPQFDIDLSQRQRTDLYDFTDPRNIEQFYNLGFQAAIKQVYFGDFFDD